MNTQEFNFVVGTVYKTSGGWKATILAVVDDTLLVKHQLNHGLLVTTKHNLDGSHKDRPQYTLTRNIIVEN